MTDTSNFDIDSLLNGTLDDIPDLPEFRAFPAGTYVVNASVERSTKKEEKSLFFFKMKMKEQLELVNADDKPLEVGAEANIRYDVSNEFALGAFKKILNAASEHFGAGNNGELIAHMQNVECLVVTKQVQSKKNKDQFFTDIVELKVV